MCQYAVKDCVGPQGVHGHEGMMFAAELFVCGATFKVHAGLCKRGLIARRAGPEVRTKVFVELSVVIREDGINTECKTDVR